MILYISKNFIIYLIRTMNGSIPNRKIGNVFFFFWRMGWQCISRMEVETLIHNHNNASGNIEKDIMGLFGYNLFY